MKVHTREKIKMATFVHMHPKDPIFLDQRQHILNPKVREGHNPKANEIRMNVLTQRTSHSWC